MEPILKSSLLCPKSSPIVFPIYEPINWKNRQFDNHHLVFWRVLFSYLINSLHNTTNIIFGSTSSFCSTRSWKFAWCKTHFDGFFWKISRKYFLLFFLNWCRLILVRKRPILISTFLFQIKLKFSRIFHVNKFLKNSKLYFCEKRNQKIMQSLNFLEPISCYFKKDLN